MPLTMVLPPLALLAIRLGLGLTSGIEEHAAAAAAAFSDRAAYATAVLHPHGGPIPIGGTVVVPASPRRPRAALAVGTGWLCRLHSGLVGDQVTWLVADLALLAGLSQAALH